LTAKVPPGQEIQTGASARAGKVPKRGHVCKIKGKYMGTTEKHMRNRKKVKTQRFSIQNGGSPSREFDIFNGVVVDNQQHLTEI
jgi:hypothetical protein